MPAVLDTIAHQAAEGLLARLRALQVPSNAPGDAVLRVEVPAPGNLDPLLWLAQQRGWSRYFWAERDGAFAIAALGEADIVQDAGEGESTASIFDTLRARLAWCTPETRYIGGFRFQRGPVRSDRWKAFRSHRFVAPRIQWLRCPGGTFLAYSFTAREFSERATLEAQLACDLASLRFDSQDADISVPAMVSRSDLPGREGWDAAIQSALDAFAPDGLRKVVLARESTFEADGDFDPVAILRRLDANAGAGFRFCFSPAPSRAFVGISPELLYSRTGRLLETEALAGTRKRRRDAGEDARTRAALLSTDKDLREHAFVVRNVCEALGPLCDELGGPPEPAIMTLRHMHHLHTPISGLIREDALDDAAILDALHPTAAVGGTPRDAALRFIEHTEAFDRGIYAAPVGWVSKHAAKFSVGIRSGLVQGSRLTLYAGAGIVPGSDPTSEWNEIDTKLQGFLSALGYGAA